MKLWKRERPVLGADAVEAHSAEDVLAASEAGFLPGDIYFTASRKSEAETVCLTGKCRIAAESIEELRWINQAAQAAAGRVEPAAVRLTLDGWDGPGIRLDALPMLAAEIRRLPAVSLQGCFVQGNTAGLHGGALGRYYRDCYEAAKRMSAVLPCRIAFLCITGGGEAARRNAQEHMETLPEFRRAAEIVAAQNSSAFYARLLVT